MPEARVRSRDERSYLSYLKIERGLSNNSLDAYSRDIAKLVIFLNDRSRTLSNASTQDLQSFIRALSEIGLERSSIARIISAIRGFYRYLLTERVVDKDPTESLELKTPRRQPPDVLTVEEIELILKQPDLTTKKGARDRAILEFLYATGARVSEVTTLALNQLFLDDAMVRLFGKGSKERIVPVGKVAIKYVNTYLATIRPTLIKSGKMTDAVFLNQERGTGLSANDDLEYHSRILQSSFDNKAHHAAYISTFVCNAFARRRSRSSCSTGVTWSFRYFYHRDLYPY